LKGGSRLKVERALERSLDLSCLSIGFYMGERFSDLHNILIPPSWTGYISCL
jgi:hypothetical protein